MRKILSLLLILSAPISYALDSADLLILKNNIYNANENFGSPQLAIFIDDAQDETEKTILMRMQAIYELKNETFQSSNSKLSKIYIDRISDLDHPELVNELRDQLSLLIVISASNDEISKGHTISSLDPEIFKKPSTDDVKITGTSMPATSINDQDPLKINVQQIEAALEEIEQDEGKGLYNLAKLSFQITNPILQGAVVKTTLLGLLNKKHPKTTSYRQAVEKKLGKEMTSFFYGSDFFKTCSRCNGEGQIKRTCPTCKGDGQCSNKAATGGVIVYKGLNGKIIRKDCPTCKGTGKCPTCNGSGHISSICRVSKGTGKIFTNENVPVLYVEALGQLRNLASDIVKNPRQKHKNTY